MRRPILDQIIIVEIVIGTAAEYTHRAGVRDPKILAGGAIGTIDQSVRLNDDGVARGVLDALFRRDQELVIDGVGDPVRQAAGSLLSQCDGRLRRKLRPLSLPSAG